MRVSRFLRAEDDQTIVGLIHEGMWLRVQGKINYSKYDEDMVLEPRNIVQGEKTIRPDNATWKSAWSAPAYALLGARRNLRPRGSRGARGLLGAIRPSP